MSKKSTKKHARIVQSVAITMVVDESGSMQILKDATISGFNEYVDTVKRDLANENTFFSALAFDSKGIRTLQTSAPIKNAIHLSNENYRPDALTPLLDAIGQAIEATDQVESEHRCGKIIVVIQTDGAENASVKFNLQDIKQKIERRQAKGWQFVFIGAGIDAFSDAHKLGIDQLNTMSYRPSSAGTKAVFYAAAANTGTYTSGASADMNFNAAQSASSGEAGGIIKAKANLRAKQKPTASSGS